MTSLTPPAPARQPGASRFYAMAWRWHFYVGLYVVPFLVMLAVTGLVMVFFTGFQSRLGMTVHVAPQAQVQPVTAQAQAALAHLPGAQLKEYIAPKAPDVASWFVLNHAGSTQAVAVDPYTADVMQQVDKENTVFAWAEKIHGTLLLGEGGERFIEVAAGLAIVLVVTGLYLFWPRNAERWVDAIVPDWRATGRKWWKSVHRSVGFWMSVVLLLFLLTGMSWTGFWGAKFVQPWGTFPAAKWDAVPTSTQTHASLNTAGLHEVPWGLEQTPLPESGSQAGTPGVAVGEPVNLDGLNALALRLGYTGQFHIQLPQDAKGVYTLSADSMSGDLHNPTQDRTVHVDRYTGRVLAEAAFADYSLVAKAMAVGIALHQGDLGWLSAVANIIFCLAIVLLCVSGVVMWWLRRPQGSGRLAAPSVPAQAPLWKGGALVMLLTALAFPLAGGVLLAVLLLDWLVLSRLPGLKAALS
nr:PepSY domain-containing protein [uncultured Rhodoferax sp.]